MKYGIIRNHQCPFCNASVPAKTTDECSVRKQDVQYCFVCGAALEWPDDQTDDIVTIDVRGDIYVDGAYMFNAFYGSSSFHSAERQWREQGDIERADVLVSNQKNIDKLLKRRDQNGGV